MGRCVSSDCCQMNSPVEFFLFCFFYRSYLSTVQIEDLEIDKNIRFYVVFHRLKDCTVYTKSEPHRACTVNDMGRYGIRLTVINVNIANIRI